MRRGAALSLLLLLLLAAPASADLALTARAPRAGQIVLRLHATAGTPATVTDLLTGATRTFTVN